MRLRKLLSTLLLLPAIFLSTDAMAGGHGGESLYDLADNIHGAFVPVAAGARRADEPFKTDINKQLNIFLTRYNAEANVLDKRQGLKQLVVHVCDLAGRASEYTPSKDLVGDMIDFLQTNFVDRGIKIDESARRHIEDGIRRTIPALRLKLQALLTSNDALPG